MSHQWTSRDLMEQRRQSRVLTSGVFGMRGESDLSWIVQQAAEPTNFPLAAVSIVDAKRLWLAVAYGFDPREFDRPDSFCDAAIQTPSVPLCVKDAWQEPRFAYAPAVLEMGVRAYYAAPLVTSDGFALGTLCVLDQKPRHDMDDAKLAALVALAASAVAVIERAPNAVAYAEFSIAELCSRIGHAVANDDEALVGVLDDELQRLEAQVGRRWSRI